MFLFGGFPIKQAGILLGNKIWNPIHKHIIACCQIQRTNLTWPPTSWKQGLVTFNFTIKSWTPPSEKQVPLARKNLFKSKTGWEWDRSKIHNCNKSKTKRRPQNKGMPPSLISWCIWWHQLLTKRLQNKCKPHGTSSCASTLVSPCGDKFKTELDSLIDQGIVTPVSKPTAWVNSAPQKLMSPSNYARDLNNSFYAPTSWLHLLRTSYQGFMGQNGSLL